MKIRRVEIEDLRCFRGHRVVDFTDPSTGSPRDLTVLVGSNGSGKTTLLEAVCNVFNVFPNLWPINDFILSAGGVAVDLEDDGPIRISIGDVQSSVNQNPATFGQLSGSVMPPRKVAGGRSFQGKLLGDKKALVSFRAKFDPWPENGSEGGVLFFPHDRLLSATRGGPIEAPPADRKWVYRYSRKDKWNGSLEQAWVWMNYLDLERRQRGEVADSFPNAVDLLQAVLGSERTVRVKDGRVWVSTGTPVADDSREVLLQQLPSGEQQCVLLLGEIARNRRRGAVLVIDEPEISLHPTLQRMLVHQLRRLSRVLDMQVILATHSLEIVRSVPPGCIVSLDSPESRFDRPFRVDEEDA